MSPSRSTTRSTCQAPWSPTTRQAPNAPERRNAAPPVARASDRAASFGILRHGEVQIGRRAAEQAVAHRAADDPGLRAGEHGARVVEQAHAGAPPRWCSRGTRGPIPHVIS